MIDKNDWNTIIHDIDHLPEEVLMKGIPITIISTTNTFYNIVVDIVNQTQRKVTWVDDTVCGFDNSAESQHCGNSCSHNSGRNVDTMPILQEQFSDYDSSSEDLSNDGDEYNQYYFTPIP